MSKKNKTRLRQVFSTTIATIVILTTLLVIFTIQLPQKTSAAPAGYNYYKMITFDDAIAEVECKNIPLLVHENSGQLAGKILPTGNDICFYTSDNVTQLNHEIEYASNTTGEVVAWVNVTRLTATGTGDTQIVMYYGNFTASNQQNITNVWDSNYVGVWHLSGISRETETDSTSNYNNATGSAGTPDYNQTGVAGGSIGLAAASTEYLNIVDAASLDITTGTIECWFKPTSLAAWACPMSKMDSASNQRSWDIEVLTNGTTSHGGSSDGTSTYFSNSPAQAVIVNSWNYIVGTGTNGVLNAIVNKTSAGGGGSPFTTYKNSATDVIIGARVFSGTPGGLCTGYIDECRMSNIVRNTSWLNITYTSIANLSNFCTIGNPVSLAESASTYTLRGLAHGIFDFEGSLGATAWSNLSGYYYEVAELNMSVNLSDNVTDIRVWVGDQNDTGEYINASNISLYISSDNATFGLLGTFVDGGSNLSINSTTWNAGTMGASPFLSDVINDRNCSIYIVFKESIPATITAQDYFNTTTCHIYIGRLT